MAASRNPHPHPSWRVRGEGFRGEVAWCDSFSVVELEEALAVRDFVPAWLL
jgi:hypothetical protein